MFRKLLLFVKLSLILPGICSEICQSNPLKMAISVLKVLEIEKILRKNRLRIWHHDRCFAGQYETKKKSVVSSVEVGRSSASHRVIGNGSMWNLDSVLPSCTNMTDAPQQRFQKNLRVAAGANSREWCLLCGNRRPTSSSSLIYMSW